MIKDLDFRRVSAIALGIVGGGIAWNELSVWVFPLGMFLGCIAGFYFETILKACEAVVSGLRNNHTINDSLAAAFPIRHDVSGSVWSSAREALYGSRAVTAFLLALQCYLMTGFELWCIEKVSAPFDWILIVALGIWIAASVASIAFVISMTHEDDSGLSDGNVQQPLSAYALFSRLLNEYIQLGLKTFITSVIVIGWYLTALIVFLLVGGTATLVWCVQKLIFKTPPAKTLAQTVAPYTEHFHTLNKRVEKWLESLHESGTVIQTSP